MADPYDFLGSTSEEKPKRQSLEAFYPTAEDWARPVEPKQTVTPKEPSPADDNSFLQNLGIGAVESAVAAGKGAELWAKKPFISEEELAKQREAERHRRALYEPVMETWGGKLGSLAPAATVGAMTAPVGWPAYLANAAVSAAPALNAQEAVTGAALSLPGTFAGEKLANVGTKALNTTLGRIDPEKQSVREADLALRASGDKLGLPLSQFSTPSVRATNFEQVVAKNHPAEILKRLDTAANVKNKELWSTVDQVAAKNAAKISFDPTPTQAALDEVLNIANKPLLTNTTSVNPAKVQDIIQSLNGVKSFSEMREVQQAIGDALGQLTKSPQADHTMIAALKKAYASTVNSIENPTVAFNPNVPRILQNDAGKELREALQAASKQHREEVLPFRTGEVGDAKNPILRNYVTGRYDNDPSLILSDLNRTEARRGFNSFVVPKLEPVEAATVQKIVANPKQVKQYRSDQPEAAESGIIPGSRLREKIMDMDAIRHNAFLKRWAASDPNLFENTAFRPVSRAALGALHQALGGERGAAMLQGAGQVGQQVVSPLTALFAPREQESMQAR